MKKALLTLVVVVSLVLGASSVSMAAPDDIPDALGPNTCAYVVNPVEIL